MLAWERSFLAVAQAHQLTEIRGQRTHRYTLAAPPLFPSEVDGQVPFTGKHDDS